MNTSKNPTSRSSLLLSTHPHRRTQHESLQDYDNRIRASLLAAQALKAQETGEPWSNNPLEQWIDEDTITQAFKRWGSNPLGLPDKHGHQSPNPYYNVFKQLYKDLPPSPLALAKSQRQAALRSAELGQGKFNREDILASMPVGGTPEQRKAQAVWDLWTQDTPLYSPHNIYKMLDTTLGYNRWKENHNLPNLLTYRQTLWLLKTAANSEHFKFRVGKRAHARNLCNERYQGHLFETGERGGKVQTKLGNVYGTWRLLELLSESELTSNNANVYYKAKCEVCGTEVQKFNYRHMSKPCTECSKAVKVSITPKKVLKLRNPINIYLMPTAQVKLCVRRPIDAVAFMTFTQADQEQGWIYYEDRKDVELAPKVLAKQDPQDFSLDPDKLLKKEDLFGF